MKKITVKDKVEQILKDRGCVDNYYLIDNRITTRLSDVILHLKEEGWEFDEEKSGYIGNTKNWRYVVKKSPYRILTRTLSNGEVITSLVK